MLEGGMGKKDGQSSLLSPREQQIVNLLIQGLTNRQIARRIGVSEKWVEKLLTKMYRKTNTQCRTELVVWVLRREP
jgi:DNA-binding NarL/FixJ family response regulator